MKYNSLEVQYLKINIICRLSFISFSLLFRISYRYLIAHSLKTFFIQLIPFPYYLYRISRYIFGSIFCLAWYTLFIFKSVIFHQSFLCLSISESTWSRGMLNWTSCKKWGESIIQLIIYSMQIRSTFFQRFSSKERFKCCSISPYEWEVVKYKF